MQRHCNSQETLDIYRWEDHGNALNRYDKEELTIDGKKLHRCAFPDCGKIFRFKSEIEDLASNDYIVN